MNPIVALCAVIVTFFVIIAVMENYVDFDE